MNNRRSSLLLLGGSVLALALVAGCVDRDAQAQARRTEAIVADPTIPVQVQPIETRDLDEVITISGTLVTNLDVQIAAKIPGRLVSVQVREGDRVAAGQVIATQETVELNAQLQQAIAQQQQAQAGLVQAERALNVNPEITRSNIAAAEAQLRQAQASLDRARAGARPEERAQAQAAVDAARAALDNARTQLERSRRLFEEGAIAKVEVEAAELQFVTALSQYEQALEGKRIADNATRPEDLRAAEEQVRAAEEQVRSVRASERLDANLVQQVDSARAQLRAAQEGVRLARQALSDATVRAPFAGTISGRPSEVGTLASPGTPIARIIGVQGLHLQAQVTELQVRRVTVGAPVEVSVGGIQKRGVVAAIDPLAGEVGRLFNLRVELQGDLSDVRAGMFATGTLRLGIRENVTVAPNPAIIRDGEDTFVFVVEGTRARRVPVTLGISNGNVTEIQGVSEGDQLVIQGQDQLFDDAEVDLNGEGSP